MITINFNSLRTGDKVILKGSRKQPVYVKECNEEMIKYMTPKGSEGVVVKNNFKNKAYDIRNNTTKVVNNIIRR